MKTMHVVLLLLTPLAIRAQVDERWTLRADSFAVVPVQDLRTAATFRLAQDNRLHLAALEVGAMGAEAERLREGIDHERRATADAMRSAELCDTERTKLVADRNTWQRKAQRRGRTVAMLVAVAAALTLATLAP